MLSAEGLLAASAWSPVAEEGWETPALHAAAWVEVEAVEPVRSPTASTATAEAADEFYASAVPAKVAVRSADAATGAEPAAVATAAHQPAPEGQRTAGLGLTAAAAAPLLSSELPVAHLPNGPPPGGLSAFQTEATEDASSTDVALSDLLASGLATLATQLPTWGAFFNLGSINWAAQGLTSLSLPVLPDSLDTLFGLGSKLSSVTLPDFSAATDTAALVGAMTNASFTVHSVTGGLTLGDTTIPASTGSTLLEGSITLLVAAAFGVDPGSGAESFNGATPSLLAGLSSSANLDGSLTWTGSLSLSLHFLVDSSAGFLLTGESALVLTTTGAGTLAGTAPVGGAAGTTVTGTADATLAITLGFRDATATYGPTDFAASNVAATATGSAGVSLAFTTGPASLTFGASYTLTADLLNRTVTQAIGLTLGGHITLPGVTTAAGTAGAVDLTGAFNASTQTWTLTGAATPGLRLLDQTLNQLAVTTTISGGAFSGTFEAGLALDFLRQGDTADPVTVNLSATYDHAVVNATATAAIATLDITGPGASRLLALTGATLTGTFAGDIAADTFTGSLSVGATSAALQPDQTRYSATVTDGATDADALGLTGSYDFATGVFALTLDEFTLLVAGALRATGGGVSVTYDRHHASANQTIAELLSLDVELLALQQTGSAPPTVNVSKLTIRTDGFAVANASATFGDYTLGGAVAFGSLTVTLTDLDYTIGAAPTGTLGLAAASATLFPGGPASATLTTLTGAFNLTSNAFHLSIAQLDATVGATLAFTGSGIDFNYDPTGPPSQILISAQSLAATVPGVAITGTLGGLQVTAAGAFSAETLALDSSGLASTLGLGGLLPFDITSLFARFHGDTNANGVRDPGETFSLTAFDLTVRGAFDFSKLSALPFTPIVRIGAEADATAYQPGTPQPFEFTLAVDGGTVRPLDLGPITIGFSDLTVGNTVTLAGVIHLGGYQGGVFVPTFGGEFSLVTGGQVSGVAAAAAATLTGAYDATAGTVAATGSLTVSFTYGANVDVRNAELAFALSFEASVGFELAVSHFALTSGSVESVSLRFGSLMTLHATGAVFNFTATGREEVASFASLTVSFPDLGNLTGSATHFGFAADGSFLARPGFGVTVDADAGALQWPDWIPIAITKLEILWRDFDADPLDFQLLLSASVTSLNGLSALSVQGTVEDAIIDLGLLKQGHFPITGLGAVAISVSGDLFGGTVSGALVLGIIRLDANGNRLAGDDLTTPVAQRVLYGGVQAGFSFGGLSGFSIRLGVSALGPLQVYLEIDSVQILEPFSGLAISNFRAGVTFDTTLDAITDPLRLRDASFKPANQLTLAEWVAQLEAAVVNQARAPPSESLWHVFARPMRIEGGATLFSAYASEGSFRADVDILFDTQGRVLINARGVFGDTFSLDFKLYADLTQIQSTGVFLFLADLPQHPSTLTLRGSLIFRFLQADGTPADGAGPASTFFLELTGGIDASLAGTGAFTLEGRASLAFSGARTTLDFDATLKMGPLGDTAKAAGRFVFQHAGDTFELWGVARVEVAFTQLESKGIFATGSALLELNTTPRTVTESIALPGESPRSFTLAPTSILVVITGDLQVKEAGSNWFKLHGTFTLSLNPAGFDMTVDADLLIGDPAAPTVTLKATGYFAIRATGIAARADLTLVGQPGGATSQLHFDATFQLLFNTTGATVSYTLPAVAPPINSSRTVSVPGTGPGTTRAGAYFIVDIRGNLSLSSFQLTDGQFTLRVSPGEVYLEVAATFELKTGASRLLGFSVAGGFDVTNGGVAAALTLSLKPAQGPPSSQGWSISGTFRLEFNSRATAATVAGHAIPANTVRVSATGTLTVGTFTLEGGFLLSVSGSNVHLEADATLPIRSGNTTILTLKVTGGLDVSSAGLASVLTVSFAPGGTVPTHHGWSLSATFRLELNTRATAVMLSGITVPAHTVRVFADGTLTASGFSLKGQFYLTVSSTSITLAATASFEIARVKVDVTADLGVFADGLAAKIAVNVPQLSANSFEVRGTFTLALNTTGATRFEIAARSGYLLAEKVTVSAGGFELSGTVRVSSTGRLDIPATDPLTFSLLGQTASLSGFLDLASGTFDLTGRLDVHFGVAHVADLQGTLTARLYRINHAGRIESGLTGTFNATLNGFGVKLADLRGTVDIAASGAMRFSVSTSFTLSSFVSITATTTVDIDRHQRLALTFDGSFNIFDRFKADLIGYAKPSEGKWSLVGYASASFGNDNLGASLSARVVLGTENHLEYARLAGLTLTITYTPGLYLSGSAWAKVTVAGITFGIEGSFSTTLTADHASVHVEGSICVGICVSASKTVSINFRTGHVSLSEIGYATVFLDLNGNGLHDAGEPLTVTDATGSFTFDPPPANLTPAPPVPSRFDQLDRTGDGVLDATEGRFLLLGGTRLDDGTPNPDLVALPVGALAGRTAFTGAVVFFDANFNGLPDTDEVAGLTDADGRYTFLPALLPAGTVTTDLGELHVFDLDGNGRIDLDEGTILLIGGTDLADGTAPAAPVALALAQGHANYSLATVFLDLNGNGQPDPGEPVTISSPDGFYSLTTGPSAGHLAKLGLLAPFDLNRNGTVDSDEGVLTVIGGRFVADQPALGATRGQAFTGFSTLGEARPVGVTAFAGATIFLDRNGNGQPDTHEPRAVTGADGHYTFLPAALAARSATLGALAPHDRNGNGAIDPDEGRLVVTGGTPLGTRVAPPGDPFHFPAELLAANSPSGMLRWAGATVFLDLNGNGVRDAGEAATFSDAAGFYTFLDDAAFNNELGALAAYDLDANGRLDPAEGVFVLTGGIDLSTGLENRRTLTILATNYGSIFGTRVTPIAEIYSLLVLDGLTPAAANAAIQHAFGLPQTVDALTLDLAAPGLADEAQAAAKLISTFALAGAEILLALDRADAAQGRSPLTLGQAEDLLVAALADHIRNFGPSTAVLANADGDHIGAPAALRLTDAATLRAVLAEAVYRAQLVLPFSPVYNAAIDGLRHVLARVDAIRAADLADPTGALARVAAVVELHFSAGVADLLAGRLDLATFTTRFSPEGLRDLIRFLDLPRPNQAPTLAATAGTQQTFLDRDQRAPLQLGLRIADADDLPDDIQLTVTTNTPGAALVAAARLVGTGADRILVVDTLPGRTGTILVTLVGTDRATAADAARLEVTVTLRYTYAEVMHDLAQRARTAEREAEAAVARADADEAAAPTPAASVSLAPPALVTTPPAPDLGTSANLTAATLPRRLGPVAP